MFCTCCVLQIKPHATRRPKLPHATGSVCARLTKVAESRCYGGCTVHARGQLGSYDPAALLRRAQHAVDDPEVYSPASRIDQFHTDTKLRPQRPKHDYQQPNLLHVAPYIAPRIVCGMGAIFSYFCDRHVQFLGDSPPNSAHHLCLY